MLILLSILRNNQCYNCTTAKVFLDLKRKLFSSTAIPDFENEVPDFETFKRNVDFENELPACSDHPLFNAQIDQIFS